MFTASEDDCKDAYFPCLSLVFRHWVTNRLSRIPCQNDYRVMPMGDLVRLTVNSKAILKRAGIFIPTTEYMKHHIFELRRKI